MYECFHCLAKAVIWDADFNFEDYGMAGYGIVQELHCENCGAMITYLIPIGGDDDDEQQSEG